MPLLLLTGHQRSGTTILRILLNSHPEISITNEFNNLDRVGSDRVTYTVHLLKRIWQLRRRRDNFSPGARNPSPWWGNPYCILRYMLRVQFTPSWRIGFPAAEAGLRSLYPKSRWVGDKYPDYIWDLESYSRSRDLTCMVIYRDGRDVVSSALEKARTTWKSERYGRHFDTAEKVARRWIRAVEIMERCSGRIIRIRYERLIAEPADVAGEIGERLGVDPAFFPVDRIHSASRGKHRSMLTPRELAAVNEIAGPALARLGYG
jgi:hypothetical protein